MGDAETGVCYEFSIRGLRCGYQMSRVEGAPAGARGHSDGWMAQDPKAKKDKTPDLTLVGPPSSAAPSAPARAGSNGPASGPPPLPTAARSSPAGAASAAAARIETEPAAISLPAPKPSTDEAPQAAKPPVSKPDKPDAPAAKNTFPPPLNATAKAVKSLQLSELQRGDNARAPKALPPPEPARSSAAAEKIAPAKEVASTVAKPTSNAQPRDSRPNPPLPDDNPEEDLSASADPGATDAPERRAARRRPAGPSRARIAANDDAPSIGGLIYALNEKPSNKPFVVAAAASGVWAAIAIVFAWAFISQSLSASEGFFDALGRPATLGALVTILGPIALFWFLALLAWRTEDLRLRSTAMTEVAVRLAEPDRMAEQSVASLGQAVRRQVSFMNDAVSRALGRAGELEALVHNEVTALERSYEDNERKIRSLIQELSGERNALLNTTERVNDSLKSIAGEVPVLIDKLSHQQIKLASIIEGAGQNLTALEQGLAEQTGQLEHTLGSRAQHMQAVLEDYTSALGTALSSRSDQMQAMFEGYRETIDTSIASRTENLQTVFEEYARALDATLANRAQALDVQLVQRTSALDQAFSERL